jgi:hypothetical protein
MFACFLLQNVPSHFICTYHKPIGVRFICRGYACLMANFFEFFDNIICELWAIIRNNKLGVEVGLTPNFMKGIHIFPLSIVGSFYFYFLPSKLDVQCMVIVKKEQNKILFQDPFKLMFSKYNKHYKVGEGHLNSYFYKKSKFYKVCNDSKSNVCFNIVVGFGN